MKKLGYIFGTLLVVLIGAIIIFGQDGTTVDTADETTTDTTVVTQADTGALAVSRLGQEGVYVIDVRTVEEWQDSHVDGAVWWGLAEELEQGNMPDITQNSEIYVYCRSGNRSAAATQILQDNGFSNVNDAGAITNLTDSGASTTGGDVILP